MGRWAPMAIELHVHSARALSPARQNHQTRWSLIISRAKHFPFFFGPVSWQKSMVLALNFHPKLTHIYLPSYGVSISLVRTHKMTYFPCFSLLFKTTCSARQFSKIWLFWLRLFRNSFSGRMACYEIRPDVAKTANRVLANQLQTHPFEGKWWNRPQNVENVTMNHVRG